MAMAQGTMHLWRPRQRRSQRANAAVRGCRSCGPMGGGGWRGVLDAARTPHASGTRFRCASGLSSYCPQ